MLVDEHGAAHQAKPFRGLGPVDQAHGEVRVSGHGSRTRAARGRRFTSSAQFPPTGNVSLSGDMPEWQAGEDGHGHQRAQLRDDAGQVIAAVVAVELVLGELPQQDRALPREHAGMVQLVQHALDAIRVLAHVLQEQDAAVDARKVRRADQVRDHGQVAAPERARRAEFGRSVEIAVHLVGIGA